MLLAVLKSHRHFCGILLVIALFLGLGPLLWAAVQFLWEFKGVALILIIAAAIGIASQYNGSGSSLTEEDRRRIQAMDWEERHPHD